MAERIQVYLNGRPFEVEAGVSVAAALMQNGVFAFRTSVTGEARAPLCGMGICHECRATVNGVAHEKTCLILCEAGMRVETGG